jgi:ubiquinone/menaquinone biosynthesis C-methylase UbiE
MPDWAQKYFERGYGQRWGLPPVSDQIRLEVSGVWKHLNLGSSSRVADIGCGHGRHAVELSLRGAHVTGVDFAAALLIEAQRLCGKFRAQAHLIRGDMRLLPLRSQYFDAVILMDAFGFFETEEDNEAVLANIARILVPGGRLCLKVVNGIPILQDFRESDREEREGTVVEISRTLIPEPPRISEKISVSGLRGNGEYERRQRLYRPDEMYAMLERAGFSIVAVFSHSDGGLFDPAVSTVMWIIGERKGAALPN